MWKLLHFCVAAQVVVGCFVGGNRRARWSCRGSGNATTRLSLCLIADLQRGVPQQNASGSNLVCCDLPTNGADSSLFLAVLPNKCRLRSKPKTACPITGSYQETGGLLRWVRLFSACTRHAISKGFSSKHVWGGLEKDLLMVSPPF